MHINKPKQSKFQMSF